jgi:hypothetical protein
MPDAHALVGTDAAGKDARPGAGSFKNALTRTRERCDAQIHSAVGAKRRGRLRFKQCDRKALRLAGLRCGEEGRNTRADRAAADHYDIKYLSHEGVARKATGREQAWASGRRIRR